MTKNFSDDRIWLNGVIIPYQEAQISIMNTTAQYGINVFEGIRCYLDEQGNHLNAFMLREHLQRLILSAKLIRFDLEERYSVDYFIEAIKELFIVNRINEDCYLKIGIYLDEEGSWSACSPLGVFMLAFPKGRVYDDIPELKCKISTWERISDTVISPRIKAGANYLNSRYAFLEAKQDGYDAPIFLNRERKVSEGAGACIFMVKDGQLVTPSVTSSILESITRKVVIEIAGEKLDLDVSERSVDRTELYLADELFFVGTAMEIVPIINVDGYQIGDAHIGKITETITEQFFDLVRSVEPQNCLIPLN